jgi:hypothetical protein
MFEAYLVPEKTVVTANGDGPMVAAAAAAGRVLLLQLNITGVVEQQSLELSILAGADESSLGKMAVFPQVFYAGEYPLLLDLTGKPEVKVLRVHWDVNRWGRGPESPWFEFSVKATEVPPELWRERQAQNR